MDDHETDTSASAQGGGGDAPTELHPPTTPPEEALAWSTEEPDTELLHRPWRTAWRDAALITASAAVVAAMAGLGAWVWFGHRAAGPPAAPTTAASALPSMSSAPFDPPRSTKLADPAPPSTVTVTSEPPVTVTVTSSAKPSRVAVPEPEPAPPVDDPDAQFLAMLNAAGIATNTPAATEASGRHLCALLGNGSATKQSVADDTANNNPGLTPKQIVASVDAATLAYCPGMYGPWTYYHY